MSAEPVYEDIQGWKTLPPESNFLGSPATSQSGPGRNVMAHGVLRLAVSYQ